jgi:hypothetical protein
MPSKPRLPWKKRMIEAPKWGAARGLGAKRPGKRDQVTICLAMLRTARRGRNPGGEFWSCSGFPECRGTRPVDRTLRYVRSGARGRLWWLIVVFGLIAAVLAAVTLWERYRSCMATGKNFKQCTCVGPRIGRRGSGRWHCLGMLKNAIKSQPC